MESIEQTTGMNVDLLNRAAAEGWILLTREHVAEILGVCARTVDNLRGYGDGPPYIKRGRSVAYRVSDVVSWIQSMPSFVSTSDHSESRRT